MKIFLDTASVKEIREAAATGLLDGVTTNPSLMAKEGRPFRKQLEEICAVVEGPVSAEVVGDTCTKMIEEAKTLTRIAGNIAVKIPINQEGLKAAKILIKEGISTNITLVFSPNQALLAAKVGSTFVSPFIGRLDDAGHDGMGIVREICTIYRNYDYKTEVIVASIRHPLHVLQSAMAGAHIVTVPYGIFQKLFQHPLTDLGITKFLEDWKKVPQ
jgi:transaldolase